MNEVRLLTLLEFREILEKLTDFDFLCEECKKKSKEHLRKVVKKIDKLLENVKEEV